MSLQKSFLHLFVLSIFLLFTGCIKKLDSEGLTLKIEESELNKSSKNFPIEKDFVFANVQIEKPTIFIKKGTDRINASIDMAMSAIFLPEANTSIAISGEPFFDKDKSAIFLKNVQIEKFDLSDLDINKDFANLIMDNIKPIINTLFKNIPIYEIDKSSFKGSFVKDVKIENSELLITFGL